MKKSVLFLLSLLVVVANSNAQLDTGEPPTMQSQSSPRAKQILLECKVFEIRGDVSGDTSLTEDIWVATGRNPNFDKNKPYNIFVLAELNIGSGRLEADSKRWSWDDEFPDEVTVVCSPQVLMPLGQSFIVAIGEQSEYQYFRRRDDGLFELDEIRMENPGLSLSGAVEQGPGDIIILRDLKFETTLVTERQPIEGVHLNVGKPVFRSSEFTTTMAVKPGQYYGIQILAEARGHFVIQLRATWQMENGQTARGR